MRYWLTKEGRSKRRIHQGGNIQCTKYSIRRSGRYKWNMEQIPEKGINEVTGKMVGKKERAHRNSWFDEECQIMLEDKKRAYNKMINRNTRQNEQEYMDKRKEAYKIFRHKQWVLFKSKLEQMDIAYNNNEANKFYQEVSSIRKGFRPQTLLIRDKESE